MFLAWRKRIPLKIGILLRFVSLKSILFNLLRVFDFFFFFRTPAVNSLKKKKKESNYT